METGRATRTTKTDPLQKKINRLHLELLKLTQTEEKADSCVSELLSLSASLVSKCEPTNELHPLKGYSSDNCPRLIEMLLKFGLAVVSL